MLGRWTVVFAAAMFTGCGDSAKNQAKAPPPPVAVKVAPVIQRTIPLLVENVGQTRGSVEVEIRARVEGFLDRVAFEEGRPVKKGDLLYEIDPKPFKAALDRANSDLATAEAAHAKARNDVA